MSFFFNFLAALHTVFPVSSTFIPFDFIMPTRNPHSKSYQTNRRMMWHNFYHFAPSTLALIFLLNYYFIGLSSISLHTHTHFDLSGCWCCCSVVAVVVAKIEKWFIYLFLRLVRPFYHSSSECKDRIMYAMRKQFFLTILHFTSTSFYSHSRFHSHSHSPYLLFSFIFACCCLRSVQIDTTWP